jgi:hypothetical protein
MQRRRVRILAGNHEEMFLGAFEREETLRHFLRHGGRETLLSYPIDPDDYARMTLEELRAAMPGFVPQDDLAFLRSLEDQVRSGTMSSSMPAFVPACRLTSRCRATCAGFAASSLPIAARAISPWCMATPSSTSLSFPLAPGHRYRSLCVGPPDCRGPGRSRALVARGAGRFGGGERSLTEHRSAPRAVCRNVPHMLKIFAVVAKAPQFAASLRVTAFT